MQNNLKCTEEEKKTGKIENQAVNVIFLNQQIKMFVTLSAVIINLRLQCMT